MSLQSTSEVEPSKASGEDTGLIEQEDKKVPKQEDKKVPKQEDKKVPKQEDKKVPKQDIPAQEGKARTKRSDEIDDAPFNQEIIAKLRAAFGEIPKLGVEKMTEVDKEAHKRKEIQLISQHRQFARKVFDYLKMCLGLEMPGDQKHDEYYERYMGEAILAISMIFREEWRKIFTRIHNSMTDPRLFVLYCCTIPIERNSHFFIDYLQRFAVIFEMVLYMFDDGHDFFEIGTNCAAEFVDVFFFKNEGDWPLLKRTAAMISMATRPLRFVMNCPKEGTKCFGDVLKKLDEYVDDKVINMTSREHELLHKLNKKCNPYIAALKKRTPTTDKRRVMEEEKDLIVDFFNFFQDCLPVGDEKIEFSITLFDQGHFEVCLESWMDTNQTNTFKEALEMERDLQRGKVSEVELKQSLEKKDSTIKDSHRGSKFEKVFKNVHCEGFAEAKGLKPKVRAGKNYYMYENTNVKWFLQVYTRSVIVYIYEYNRKCIVPSYKLSCYSKNRDIFVMDRDFYENRRKLNRPIDAISRDNRMWACLLPSKDLRVVPIDVQRLLDIFVIQGLAGHLDIPGVEKPMMVLPKLGEGTEDRPVWIVKGLLEKSGSLLEKGIAIKERVDRLLKKTFRTCQVDVSKEKVQEFRLQAKLKKNILSPPRTPSKSPFKKPKTPSKSPKTPSKSSSKTPTKSPKTPQKSAGMTSASKSPKTPPKSSTSDDKVE